MSGSLNKVTLIGNLGKDPEVRRLSGGSQVVSFSLAMSETWNDKNSGERKEKTEWANIVIFNEGLGKIAEKYLKKGSKAYLEGKLQTRKWQDQSGNDKYTTEVVLQNFDGKLLLLGDRNSGGGTGEGGGDRSDQQGYSNRGGGFSGKRQTEGPLADDDIPFNCEYR